MGRQMLQRHASLLARVEKRFGVPPEIIVAIWGLESDYGKGDIGKMPVVRTLATMAHDCRRTELFQGELLAALKIAQRGDLPLRDMIGAFAGEIGQTQFMPKAILAYGTGNLENSANALNSTANFLKAHGWRTGAGYQPGEPNFAAIQAWNAAGVYQKAIALMGRQIDGGE